MKRNKMIKTAAAFLAIFMLAALILGGCRQSTITSYNISKEADNFNVTRRLAVINARTDKPIFELVGKFALSNNNTNELEIICQTGPNEFKKHYVYLNEWTIYIVEDVSGAHVDSFHYEVNFLPEMFGVVWTQSK